MPGLLAAVILMVVFFQASADQGTEGADGDGRPDSHLEADGETEALPRSPDGVEAGPAADPTRDGHAQPWHREPKYIMMRSVLVPGWGQLANGRLLKGLLLGAGETYFVWRAVHYGRRERDLTSEALEHPEGSFERANLSRRADYAGDRRRDSVWWAIFSVVLSMGDAYVDAHLGRNFEVEFEPQDLGTGRADGGDAGFRIGIRRSFW